MKINKYGFLKVEQRVYYDLEIHIDDKTYDFIFLEKEPYIAFIIEKYIVHFKTEEEIISYINKLPEIDRKILVMRFGINGGEYNTFKQIGEQFSLTKQRIEQIEKRALNILKRNKKINQVLGDPNV